MKTILRRNDNTSIYCPAFRKHSRFFSEKNKIIEATIAFTLIVVGLFIILSAL